MALYLESDIWYVGSIYRSRHSNRPLADVVKEDSHFVVEHLSTMCRTEEQQDAITAELERQKPHMDWCYKCDTSTLHTVDGCVDCARKPAPSLDDLPGPAWSVENVVARMEARK